MAFLIYVIEYWLYLLQTFKYEKKKYFQVGDSGVGKSCLLEKFIDLSSNNAFISTIGVDVRTHVIKLDGQTIKMQVITVNNCMVIAITYGTYKQSWGFY